MPARSWDDRWQQYLASVPLPAEGGLASTKQRGPMAESWWSQRFIQILESYGLGARMQRGRRYARTGQVLSLEIQPGVVAAQVQGSRRTPYLVTVQLPVPSDAQWGTVQAAMASKVGFVARLLVGEVPSELEDVFATVGVPLFPPSWAQVRAACSCPDWENPCKHIAAVLYLFADRLDGDPWLLLAWRGRDKDAILAGLRGPTGAAGDGEDAGEVAPWWPFPSGTMPDLAYTERGNGPVTAPEHADAVLDGLEPLHVTIGDVPFAQLLRPVYDHIIDPGESIQVD